MEPGPGLQAPSLVLRICSCSSAPDRENAEKSWRETRFRRPLGALIVTALTLAEVCLYALTLRRPESIGPPLHLPRQGRRRLVVGRARPRGQGGDVQVDRLRRPPQGDR